jgi:hypothetical protein
MWKNNYNKRQQIQAQETVSGYTMKVIYDNFYGTLELLEIYMEKLGVPHKKQIHDNKVKRPDVPYANAEKIHSIFSSVLFGLESITNSKPQSTFERLQPEFYSWLDKSGINVNNCPPELAQSLANIHDVLQGKGEKFAKERNRQADENIAKMSSGERRKEFYKIIDAYQEPLDIEQKRFETMKGQTYKDVRAKSKFGGEPENGQVIFTQIKSRLESAPKLLDTINDQHELNNVRQVGTITVRNNNRTETYYSGEGEEALTNEEVDFAKQRAQELHRNNSGHGEAWILVGGGGVLVTIAGFIKFFGRSNSLS